MPSEEHPIMSAHAIAQKFRRALRNGSGATFSLDQLREMASWGVLVDLSRIEANEIWPADNVPATQASTTQPAPINEAHRDRGSLSIAQLSAGID
jgi:hypothetical protein